MPKRDRDGEEDLADLEALKAIPAAAVEEDAGVVDDGADRESLDNAFDNITENEEAENRLEELDGMGQEFLDWVGPDSSSVKQTRQVTQRAVEDEFQRLGLPEANFLHRDDLMSERLDQIDITHRKSFAVGDRECEIDIFAEARWVVEQLAFTAHGLLSTDESLISSMLRDDWGHPALEEIANALGLIHQGIEPALIAIHHQHKFQTLSRILWSPQRLQAAKSEHLPDPNLPVNIRTGQRQLPDFRGGHLFTFTAQTPSITGEYDWYSHERSDRSVRKPTDIQLGRLMWVIADLDHQLYRYEKSRQSILATLDGFKTSHAIMWHSQKLSEHVFRAPIDSASWKEYEVHCQQAYGTGRTSAMSVIINCGLLGDLMSYVLPPHEFAQNVDEGMNVHTLPARLEYAGHPEEWFQAIGNDLDPVRSGNSVINLFNRATSDILSHSPIIIRKVYEAFKSKGLCIVTREGNCSSLKIADLFERNPLQYLQLSEEENTHLKLHLAPEELMDVLRPTQLLDTPKSDDINVTVLHELRSPAISTAMTQLRDFVARQLDIELVRDAQAIALRQSQEAFGRMAVQGPYEPSTLTFSNFPKVVPSLWESNWNVIEATPAGDEADSSIMRSQARVCAVFRANNSVTTLVCCDETGAVNGYVRWVDCALQTEEGKAIEQEQLQALFQLVSNCQPNIIAVAATSPESGRLFKLLERFVKDRVHPELHYHLPVGWVEAEVSISVSWSSAAIAEFPQGDIGLRTAVSLARYVRDPLLELCRLFHEPVDCLALPLAHLYGNKIPPAAMVRALERETSLWMASVAPEVNRVLRLSQPHLVLQFFPGLGRVSAPLFLKEIEAQGGLVSSREQINQLLQGCRGELRQNISSGMRVVLPLTQVAIDHAQNAHILDCTLIPTDHYETATVFARFLAQCGHSPYAGYGQAAIMELWMKPAEERYAMLGRVDLLGYVESTREGAIANNKPDFNLALMCFIMDELCNKGDSTMRRTYRCMSDLHFLRVTTGVIWAQKRTKALDQLGEANVLCVGDIISGVPIKTRSGNQGQPPVLELRTQSGLTAMMDIDTIGEAEVKYSLKIHAEDGQGKNGPKLPDYVRNKGSQGKFVMHARIKSLNMQRGELHVDWHPTPAPAAGLESSHEPRYSGEITSVGDDRSARTIETIRLLHAAKAHATKISRHELYRNVPAKTANLMLKDRQIGEYLLHPSSRDVRKVYVVLKVGEKVKPLNLLLEEFSLPDGTIAYKYKNPRTHVDAVFEDPDHCFARLVDRMIQNVNAIVNHISFLPNVNHDSVQKALSAQRRGRGNFPYVLCENVNLDDGSTPSPTAHYTPYCLYYYTNNNTKLKHCRLHIEESFYIRLSETKYHQCYTVEDMVESIKRFQRKEL